MNNKKKSVEEKAKCIYNIESSGGCLCISRTVDSNSRRSVIA